MLPVVNNFTNNRFEVKSTDCKSALYVKKQPYFTKLHTVLGTSYEIYYFSYLDLQ